MSVYLLFSSRVLLMKHFFSFIISIATLLGSSTLTFPIYEWAIIGAGPGGITALGVLLNLNINPQTIIWIDREFNLGRMGKYYRNVPGNLQTKRLTSYINECETFQKFKSQTRDALFTYDPELFQPLYIMIEPLIDATHYLRSQTYSLQDSVISVTRDNNYWILEGENNTIYAHKVILAIGSHPKKHYYPLVEINSDEALDKEKLYSFVLPQDCIAVFGGMHSALLILKNLSELGVKKIINFYASPYFYGKPGAAGLEGITAEWAKTVLENNPPANLIRVQNTQENINEYLPLCNKVIYAMGYERNPILVNGSSTYQFDESTGVIEPHLYGIGIAFAPTMKMANGKRVELNGFNTYLKYAQILIPNWIKQ